MVQRKLTKQHLILFREFLVRSEKSEATIEKYLRDTKGFLEFTDGLEVTKELTVTYKKKLQKEGYAVRSVNSMLASVNSILDFLGWSDCKVKMLRCQRETYCAEEKELSKSEYIRLLEVSGSKSRMNLVIQTICGTGIRVSELKYFTVEAVFKGEITVQCKNKIRIILVPTKLRKLLMAYARNNNIMSGVIFRTRSGKPVDRSNIWKSLKKLCNEANINPDKVFPHNLRKLFARTFYNIEKDIAKLADILGHSSIETTRIYIMTTGAEHRKKIERLGLII